MRNRLLSSKVTVKSHAKRRKDIEENIQMSLCYIETKSCMINIMKQFFQQLACTKINGQSPVGRFV